VDLRESPGARLQRVDNRYGLTVGEPGDKVGPIAEMIEYILGHAALRLERIRYLRRLACHRIRHNLAHPTRTIVGGHLTGSGRTAKMAQTLTWPNTWGETAIYIICRNFS
jgi:hypothetical protein